MPFGSNTALIDFHHGNFRRAAAVGQIVTAWSMPTAVFGGNRTIVISARISKTTQLCSPVAHLAKNSSLALLSGLRNIQMQIAVADVPEPETDLQNPAVVLRRDL